MTDHGTDTRAAAGNADTAPASAGGTHSADMAERFDRPRIIRARCSSLPLLWSCAASADREPGEIVVEESNEAAEAGTAVHRYLAALAEGRELDPDHLAAEHGVDRDEVGMLCALGRREYAKLAQYLGERVFIEQRVSCTLAGRGIELLIDGSADLISPVVAESSLLLVDFKSGRVDSDYAHQTRGYASCAMETFAELIAEHGIGTITTIIIWLRDGVWDVEHLPLDAVRDWQQQLLTNVRNSLGEYRTSSHCNYCPRCTTCPGRRQLVQATIADLSRPESQLEAIPWTPETRTELGPHIGDIYGRLTMAESAIATFRGALKEDILAHGELPIGGGRSLKVAEQNRRGVVADVALPVLREHLDEQEIVAAMKLSLGTLERAVKGKALKGRGAAAIRRLTSELEDAGAIERTTIHVLREGKATEPDTETP